MLSKEKLKIIREVDLFDLLPFYDDNNWKKEGSNYLRHKIHNSCVITKAKGWVWNSIGKKGRNPIDFLIIFYEISFNDAIKFITENYNLNLQNQISNSKSTKINSPPKAKMPWVKLYNYLCNKRGIKRSLIDYLVTEELLYLTNGKYQNACFKNYDNSHYEIVGITPKRFKQISDSEKYWSFGRTKRKAYICESAIDAISLFQILGDRKATYISIGGSASREKVIKKVCKEYEEVIIAVDNDAAGDKVAILFPNLQRIIPKSKDWNEDLKKN